MHKTAAATHGMITAVAAAAADAEKWARCILVNTTRRTKVPKRNQYVTTITFILEEIKEITR